MKVKRSNIKLAVKIIVILSLILNINLCLGKNFVHETPEAVKAWKVLDEAGSSLRTNIIALGKIDFLKTHGLSDAQLLKIAQLDDIKAINIADDLAKRTNPSVPLNQLDLIPSNAKALEGVRPTIMDEIGSMSSNPNLKNPDALHGFLSNAKNSGNINKTGWKYELDVANEKLGNGANIEFSRKVADKEIDILDYTASRIVEVKSYSSGNWTTIAKKFGDDVGAQIEKIDATLKSQFAEHVGRVRIESSGNAVWNSANKQGLIQEIQKVTNDYPWSAGVKAKMDNMTHIVIENSTGIHTIEKALW